MLNKHTIFSANKIKNYYKMLFWTRGVAQAVECLLLNWEALTSNLIPTKN
jgi:hypothetical protein